jgi:peptidoglycan/LPS O-acetylase OafA/YrhL
MGFFLALTATELWLVGFSDRVGYMAVGLFMSLSVFLLMGSLDANYDLVRYFKRRIRRTWPLYFAVCFAVFFLMDPNTTNLLYNLTFVAVFFPQHAFLVPYPVASGYVVWNLQIEEWAYMCFPLIALLTHRYRLMLAGALIGFSIALYIAIPGVAYIYTQTGLPYNTPWPWLACFGFGLIAYELRANWKQWGVLTVPPMCVGILIITWPWSLLLCGPFTAWVIKYPPVFLRRFALVAIGECSYAIYLVHMMFIDYLGPVGAAVAFPVGWILEYIQRGKDMLRHIHSTHDVPA